MSIKKYLRHPPLCLNLILLVMRAPLMIFICVVFGLDKKLWKCSAKLMRCCFYHFMAPFAFILNLPQQLFWKKSFSLQSAKCISSLKLWERDICSQTAMNYLKVWVILIERVAYFGIEKFSLQPEGFKKKKYMCELMGFCNLYMLCLWLFFFSHSVCFYHCLHPWVTLSTWPSPYVLMSAVRRDAAFFFF